MKERNLYFIILGTILFLSCTKNENSISNQNSTPDVESELVRWETMNKSGLKNMGFPTWFNPKQIKENNISQIKICFYNLGYPDSIVSFSDTMPTQQIRFEFTVEGDIYSVNSKEYDIGILISETEFSYTHPTDKYGYSFPSIINKKVNDYTNTSEGTQGLEQYQILKLIESPDDCIRYSDISSFDAPNHIFIPHPSHWNISFINRLSNTQLNDIFYFGSPHHFLKSFSIQNLVEKRMVEKRNYISNDGIRKQSFYFNRFVNNRSFIYDDNGICRGFIDSLKTVSGDFIQEQFGQIKHVHKLPEYLDIYQLRMKDTLVLKRMKFSYKTASEK